MANEIRGAAGERPLQGEEFNSTAQLASAAGKFVRPDDLVWLVIGDLRKIEAGVRELGWGEVTVLDGDGKPVAQSLLKRRPQAPLFMQSAGTARRAGRRRKADRGSRCRAIRPCPGPG
ncbi:hypothetical protein [Janthinobacterium psychrotolerans]|uniref:hypothetical protein n=1 Tax=Janthinobacterium psychrotolerans TaxID=1747903 RepID=UPI00123735BD|nr:hypothetical protein [Janthinobacterium psychrotolerans]